MASLGMPVVLNEVTSYSDGTGFGMLQTNQITVDKTTKQPGTTEWTQNPNLCLWAIGTDSLAIVVAANSPIAQYITNLTDQQVSDLFSSTIYTTWRDFNANAPAVDINCIVCSAYSGIADCFKNSFLTPFGRTYADLSPSTYICQNKDEIYGRILYDDYAIGFISLSYLRAGGLKGINLYNQATGTYVEPTTEHVIDGTYNIKRWLYYMTNDVPTTTDNSRHAATFISYVMNHPELITNEGIILKYRTDFAGRACGDTNDPIHPSLPDGKITAADYEYFARGWIGYYSSTHSIDSYCDLNGDGAIDQVDYAAFSRAWINYYNGVPPP
jgi:hypothetical protein